MKKSELKKQVKELAKQLQAEREKKETYKEAAHSLFSQLTTLEEKRNIREALINDVAMFEVQYPTKHEKPPFEYKAHINLIDNASKQLSEFYHVSFMDARGAMEQAIKEAQSDKYQRAKDSITHKIDFKEVVMYADTLLRTGFKKGINFLNKQEVELTKSNYYNSEQYPF